jgi:hypothetical protein
MREQILLTLRYFDLFDYPLKKEEIWQWLIGHQNTRTQEHQNTLYYEGTGQAENQVTQRRGRIGDAESVSKEDMNRELKFLLEEKLVEGKEGFYFLQGRGEIIEIRKKREEISLGKIKKAERVSRILALIPGVKMMAVCSNLGYLNADEEADIDFFIVAEKGKIWSVRFWSTLTMKLLRQRPQRGKTRNKICLSYFVTEDNLNLEATAISEVDYHLVYLVAQYLLIYDENNYWEVFVQENRWLNKFLPNFEYRESAKRFLIKSKFLWLKKLIHKTTLPFEEKLYRWIQLKIMPRELKEAAAREDKKVIINERMLKLHVNDRRADYNRIIARIVIELKELNQNKHLNSY